MAFHLVPPVKFNLKFFSLPSYPVFLLDLRIPEIIRVDMAPFPFLKTEFFKKGKQSVKVSSWK